MDFLYQIEDSSLGMMISSSLWGYPIALTLHALGMGVLVGISAMLCLRVIGFSDDIPRSAIKPFWRLAQAGFIVNLLSGTALFTGSASSLAQNWAFLTKLSLLFISLLLTYRMVKVAYRIEDEVQSDHRLLAFCGLTSWILTITAGRMIGYVF